MLCVSKRSYLVIDVFSRGIQNMLRLTVSTLETKEMLLMNNSIISLI